MDGPFVLIYYDSVTIAYSCMVYLIGRLKATATC